MTNEQSDAVVAAINELSAAIKATRTALNAILDLVGENNELLRGECAAREELARRREKDKFRKRSVRGQIEDEKEKKTEKEPSPHTPYKEEKEEIEKDLTDYNARAKETLLMARERVTEEGFPVFWERYPGFRKNKKKEAKRKFHARMMETKDPDALLVAILGGLDAWKLCRQWNESGGKYIQAPEVWLYNECWKPESIPPPMPKDGIDDAVISERAELAKKAEKACAEARQKARDEVRQASRQNRFQHADNYIQPGEGFLEQLNAVTGG